MSDTIISLLGLGDNTVDVYVDQHVMFPGGNAVNVAVHTKRLGAEAGYLGCLGNDACAKLLFDSLSEEGIDLSRCRRIEAENAHARVGHRNGDRMFLGSTPGCRAAYTLDADDFAYIAGFDMVHTSYCSDNDDAIPAIADAAKRLSYDFSNRTGQEKMARLAPFVDIAFVSFANQSDDACLDALRAIAAMGPRAAVMTRGDQGAVALVDDKFYRQAIVPTKVVDTLGAGDAFIAGFLRAFIAEETVSECLRLGAETAAQTCRSLGGFGHGAQFADGDIPSID